MWRMLSVMAYDVMDQVQITAHVRLYDAGPEGGSEMEVRRSITVQGVGSGDGETWARDALVALAETM
jgi:hypothetical protein